MEMKNAIAREGREAKNLILYHLSSEDESNLGISFGNCLRLLLMSFVFLFVFDRNKCQETSNTH